MVTLARIALRLIRRMANENRLWGEERIANELLLKLGIRISPRTVSKYLPIRPPGQPRGDQCWSTFLKNHATAILACDFFVAVTATFRMLYVFVVIEHGTRRPAHVNVTAHPSTDWTLQQLREVVGDADSHKYLIHDREQSARVPKSEFRHRLAAGALVLAKSVLSGLHHEYSISATTSTA